MRGGDRYGAGRPSHHNKTDSFRCIDVRRWAREGRLTPNNYFGWQWTYEGQKTASIGVHVNGGHSLTLKYTYALNDDEKRQSVSFPISLTHTPCHLGGERVWFICPDSGQRVAKLYLYRGGWYCRKALDLRYQSQSDDYLSRIHKNRTKIESLLEGNGPRKYLHRKTIERLVQKLDHYERLLDASFFARFGSVLGI